MSNQINIRLDDIDVDPDFNGRVELHRDAIQKYLDAVEYLPPIRVWRNPDFDEKKERQPEGNMPYKLLDGRHRLEAYRLAAKRPETKDQPGGKRFFEIPCIVEDVDRAGAQSIGMIANMQSGVPYTLEERDMAVINYMNLHPETTLRDAQAPLSIHFETIRRIMAIGPNESDNQTLWSRISRHVDQLVRNNATPTEKMPKHPTRQLLYEIVMAPKEFQLEVADNVMMYGWTRNDVRAAIKVLRDKKATPEQKQAALAHGEPKGPKEITVDDLKRHAEALAELDDSWFDGLTVQGCDEVQLVINSLLATAADFEHFVKVRREALTAAEEVRKAEERERLDREKKNGPVSSRSETTGEAA